MRARLRPRHLRRYKDVAALLLRYGQLRGASRHSLEALLGEDDIAVRGGTMKSEALAQDLERLGPTFIKLGQLLSSRSDLLSPAHMEALSRLQDRVEPVPFEDIRRTLREELGTDLAATFVRLDPEPVASASIGQVHSGVLRDGRPVAIKVQRPGVSARIADDLEALDGVARLLEKRSDVGRRFDLRALVQEFRRTLLNELDYRREAQNLVTLGHNLASFDRIVVPQPVEDHTTTRVLTMDFVSGAKVTSLRSVDRIDAGSAELADQLLRAYLKQIFEDGFFHADPHPGNVFITDDGCLALIDLGMVAGITTELQQHLMKLLLALVEGRSKEVVETAVELGTKDPAFNTSAFNRDISDLVMRHVSGNGRKMDAGRLVLEMTRISAENRLRLPPEMMFLGKTIVNLDRVGHAIDPSFDLSSSLERHAAEVIRPHVLRRASTGSAVSFLLESREFAERLPERVNTFMDSLLEGELSVKVDAIDERELIKGLQKIANRVTVGLVLAALIIGSTVLMRVESSVTILGYPALAIVLFVVAATGGLLLAVNILVKDLRGPRDRD